MEGEYGPLEDYDAIDAAITKHRGIVQQLCTLRNSRAPIWRIPDEILSRIFLFMVSEHFYEVYGNMGCGPHQPYKWTQIICVCRRWHRVCFATRALWAFVDIGHPKRTQTLLRLSGSVPLTIISASFEKDALHLCLAEMSRIRHFLFEPPYPLEYLDSDDGRPYVPPTTGICSVRSLFLDLATPAFTRLFVSSSLTHLRCGPMDPQFSVEEMLAVLTSTPLLVELELDSALQCIRSPDSYNAPPGRQAVALPALRRMEVEDSSAAGVSCAVLLQSLEVPSQASLSFDFASSEYIPQEVAVVIGILRRIASKIFGHGNLPRTCYIRKEEHTYRGQSRESDLTVELWPAVYHLPELPDPSGAPSRPGHVTITLGVTRSPHWPENALIDAFLSTLPLSDVSTFAVHLPTFPRDVWTQLARISNATHVSASSHTLAYGLAKALAAPSDPPFPKLQALTLGDVRWDEGLLDQGGSDVPLSTRCRDALRARLAQGIPLRSIALRVATEVHETELKALQDAGLVVTVECSLCRDEKAGSSAS
ncbi:hypothetical protein PsYK624_090250 [Phanerochaete sordida]|uniref:F-box domain-containing protein n=1 Tax=Phanerochaete sordida TaxID=48140 RepID=A0A9P3GDR9_9APHY|nr:hypothetical protein PsYK624_090250 [Phanerochaete sordida]